MMKTDNHSPRAKLWQVVAFIAIVLIVFSSTFAQQADITNEVLPSAPVTNLRAFDTDNDKGHGITIEWVISSDDGAGLKNVLTYEVLRWDPHMRDSLNATRDSLSWISSKIRKYEAELPMAEASLKEALSGNVSLDSLPFLVATPKNDSEFVLTKEYVEQHLNDTIGVMTSHIPILKERQPLLPARIDSLFERFLEAFTKYPDSTIGEFDSVGTAPLGSTSLKESSTYERNDKNFIPDHTDLFYRVDVQTVDPNIRTPSQVLGPVQSHGQWFNKGLFPVLWAVVIFTILTVRFVLAAKKGTQLYVRPLAGIEAVDDAIGRATEMGRPILYLMGLGTASDIATIASFTILSRVAKRVAEYQTSLIVPCYDPIVMAVAQEVVKSSFLDAGRPNDYKEDTVFFITNAQFAYVGAVNGIMIRELPATNIYMGKFFAESLMMAETGVVSGSIQIAGTDEIAQIPFFVVACDYTLIGEELFAASAYLGREPLLLGSLKAQDYGKALVLILAIIGILSVNFAGDLGLTWLADFKDWFKVTD